MTARTMDSRFAAAVVVAVALMALPTPADAQARIGVGPGGFAESGQLQAHQSYDGDSTDHGFEYRNTDYTGVRLHYLRPYDDVLTIGVGLGFDGIYRADMLDASNFPGSTRIYELGPLFDLFATAEWRLPFAEGAEAGIGGRLGMSAVIPTGDLAAEIDDLRSRDFDVNGLPRFGWSFESYGVATRRLSSRLWLRTEVGIQWQTISLFRLQQTRGDSTYRRQWSTGTMRGRIGISVVFQL